MLSRISTGSGGASHFDMPHCSRNEFVFKVFDPMAVWTTPAKGNGTWAENGRGIAIVDAVSRQWGWHRTRSHLGAAAGAGEGDMVLHPGHPGVLPSP